jgi:hypothetical protein
MNRSTRAWLLLGACLLFREAAAEERALYEPGTQVEITGKYKELVGRELYLLECPLPLLLQKEEFLQQLLRFKSHRDNLKVTGTVVKQEAGLAVEVTQLEAAPGDLEIFTAELETLKGAAGKEDSRKLLSLLKRVLASYEGAREQGLLELAHKVGKAGVRSASAGSGDPEQETRLIREVYELLGDRDFAMESLLSVEKRFPAQSGVRELLGELGCRRYKGQWVSYEKFKEMEGFISSDGQWLKPREKDFIETVREFTKRNQTDLILRKRTEREYRLLAEKGLVEDGMKPEEVYLALGFPDRVERRLHEQKEFDQWIYGDKYYYFYAGLLVKTPTSR